MEQDSKILYMAFGAIFLTVFILLVVRISRNVARKEIANEREEQAGKVSGSNTSAPEKE
jgi:hypothetical protein